jgi:hypothetical protein
MLHFFSRWFCYFLIKIWLAALQAQKIKNFLLLEDRGELCNVSSRSVKGTLLCLLEKENTWLCEKLIISLSELPYFSIDNVS